MYTSHNKLYKPSQTCCAKPQMPATSKENGEKAQQSETLVAQIVVSTFQLLSRSTVAAQQSLNFKVMNTYLQSNTLDRPTSLHSLTEQQHDCRHCPHAASTTDPVLS
jgi:Zn finger protein HypA/HybF involved in hydrogenase expression